MRAALAFALVLVFALLVPSALAAADDAAGAGASASAGDDVSAPPAPRAAEGLLLLDRTDDAQTAIVALAQLEQQGLLGVDELARPLAPLPPSLRYQDAHPACDVDGDGVPDLVSNKLDLRS